MAVSTDRQHPFVGQVIGDYEVQHLVGYGKLGTVFEAKHVDTGQRVALKVLRHDLTAGASRSKVVHSLESLIELRHPNLMTILAIGHHQETGEMFYVMPLMSPLTLRDLISRHAPLKVRRTRKILQQVVSAVGAAHSASVFHGRLEPGAIFIEPSYHSVLLDVRAASPDRVVLASFGLVGPDARLGAYPYLPPELADPSYDAMSRASRASTDIYAIGCIAVEMLTGNVPMLADSRQETVRRRLKSDFTWPREIAKKLPKELVQTVDAALSRYAQTRTSSAFEVLRGFKAGTADQIPVGVPPRVRATSASSAATASRRPAPAGVRVLGRGRLRLHDGAVCMLQVMAASKSRFTVRAYLQGHQLATGEPVTITFPSPGKSDGVSLKARVGSQIRHYSRGLSEFVVDVTAPADKLSGLEMLLSRWGVAARSG